MQETQKQKRLLVAMHTRYNNVLTVTGSHRVVVSGGQVSCARELGNDAMVAVANGQFEPLQRVTKAFRCVPVIELEFADDAVVAAYTLPILSKGCDPSLLIDESGQMKCKEEATSDDDELTVNEVSPSEESARCTHGVEHVHATGYAMIWPDTDDGF